MLYENVSYWNPGYEVIDTIVDCNNSNTRIKIKYHPKVSEGVVWMGHYQRLYTGIQVGDQVAFTPVESTSVLTSAHFGYRQFLKDEGQETPISTHELEQYLQSYRHLNDTYVCEKQGLMIYVPMLKEKRVILIAQNLSPNEGIFKLGITRVSLKEYGTGQLAHLDTVDSDPTS